MRVLIIYSSIHHGNTKKIAEAIAATLNADMIKTEDFKMSTLDKYDLIGFGSGIYYGKFHENMINLIKKLPNLNNKKAFIFSTSGLGKAKFNLPIEKELIKHNFEILGKFSCKGYDTFGFFKLFGGISKGRPNEKDIQNAKEFAKTLIPV